MANPTTNFGWVMPTSTDLVTDLPADFNVFGQGVDTSMQYLLGGTTGQVLSKTSGTDMAFTWVTPTDQTPLTTKGDLFTFTTVDARLPVGTTGQILSADPAAATGLAWITNDIGDITSVGVTSPITGGGTSGAVTIAIQDASTAQKGSVQLSDSTSTTSSVLAATPTAVKSAYDLANAAIAKSVVTTAGDTIYRNGTVPTRLAIGTAGQVLTVNSGATAPEWATAASGGSLTLLASGSFSTGSVSLTSISQSYVNLFLIADGITPSATNEIVWLGANSGGNNYFYASTIADSTLSVGSANQYLNVTAAGAFNAQAFAINIYNYTSANSKMVQSIAYTVTSNTKKSNFGAISGTGAITSLQMTLSGGTYTAGTYKLYGVK